MRLSCCFFARFPQSLFKNVSLDLWYTKFVYYLRFLDQSEPRRGGDFYRPNLKETTPTQMNEGGTVLHTAYMYTLPITIGEMGRY